MEIDAARFEQRTQSGEELPEQADGPLVRDAEARLRQVLGAEGEPEVVAPARRRLGGLRLAGDEQRMAAEDRDRGGPHLETGHLAPHDRGQRGRVVREGLAEPRRVQAGVARLLASCTVLSTVRRTAVEPSVTPRVMLPATGPSAPAIPRSV